MRVSPEGQIGRPLLVNYGGGVNSTAVLVGMRERDIVPDAIVFADTGGEKPETYEFVTKALPVWLARAGFPPLNIVRRVPVRVTYTTLEENCLQNRTLPSIAFGFKSCSLKWKAEPIDAWCSRWGLARDAWGSGDRVTKALGYDAGELHRARESREKRYHYWYPLLEWDWGRGECIAAIERGGLEAPPKSACFFCPSSTKSEVLALKREHPGLFARAVAMEENAHKTTVKGLGRSNFSWKQLGEADERQLKLFPEFTTDKTCGCWD